MKTGHFTLAILLAFSMGALAATAQDSSQATADPLAAAAQRARDQRKDQPKAAKVYTNDNLPTNATISYVGTSAASPAKDSSSNVAPDKGAKGGAKPAASGDKAADEAALAKAKEQLATEKTDLDIDQRRFALDQQDYLAKPNHDADRETAATLQTEQDAIGAKQDEVDAAQKVVNDLKARLDAENESADSAPAPATANSKPASAPADSSATTPGAGGNSSDNNTTNTTPADPAPAPESGANPASNNTNTKSIVF